MSLDGTDLFVRSRLDYGLYCQWMGQIYLGGQALIMGCNITGWNRYTWEFKSLLWAVVSVNGTDIFGKCRLDYGL